MSGIKISNNLLKFVFGCECEFEIVCVDLKCGKIEIESIFFLMLVESNRIKVMPRKINLHTFIHLAKIKCFECGYHVLEKAYGSRVDWNVNKCGCCYSKGKDFKNRTKQPMFGLDRILEALEFVAKKVGETEC